jgi:hypothetical protein
MDTALVRGGSLLYSPVSDEVQMRLTLERPGQPPATEMALIILPKGKAPEVKPLSVKKAAPSLTAGLPVEEPAPAQAAVETEALKPFVPPPSDFKREPVATAVLGAPPAVSSPAAPAAIPANPAAYPVPARPIPEAKPPAAAPPAQTRAVAPPVETEAAEAISQVMPVVPRLFRRPVFKPETVKIAVSIDQNGNVSSVRPSAPGNVPRALIQSAETAAMQWKFKPARIGDRPVPSETILIFKFEPRP